MEYKNDVNSVSQSTQYININFDNVNNNVNNNNNINRTDDTSYQRITDTTKILDICKNDNTSDEYSNVSIAIYRYKFTNEFMNELFKFSKIYQYDHRKDFKEAWDKWMDENDDIIDEEVRRLKTLGYEGDIIDKMFKSARYYFRKKSTEKRSN